MLMHGWNPNFITSLVCCLVIITSAAASPAKQECHPLEIPECKRLGYNMTRTIPGLYLRTRLSEIKAYISFLDKTNCSSDLLFFLCTMYSPMCFSGYDRIFPCRSVCLDVKRECIGIFKLIDESWPPELACNKLPEHNTDVCIRPNAIIARTDYSSGNSAHQRNTSIKVEDKKCPPCKQQLHHIRFKQFKEADYVIKATFRQRVTTATGETKFLIEIKDRLKRGSFRVKRGRYQLVSRSKCLCNPMNLDGTYYILGRENAKHKTLLFNRKSLVQMVTPRWDRKFAKWKKRERKPHSGKTSNVNKKRRAQ